jgi:hypothetical protein
MSANEPIKTRGIENWGERGNVRSDQENPIEKLHRDCESAPPLQEGGLTKEPRVELSQVEKDACRNQGNCSKNTLPINENRKEKLGNAIGGGAGFRGNTANKSYAIQLGTFAVPRYPYSFSSASMSSVSCNVFATSAAAKAQTTGQNPPKLNDPS